LNLGCPQSRARDGGFGAFLSREKAVQCVLQMRRAIDDWYNDEQDEEEKQDGGTSAVASTTTTMGKNEKNVNNKTSQRRNKKIRLSCKMRLRDEGIDETIAWAKAMAAAGCEILAIHCRRRDCKFDGAADLNAGRAIVQAVSPGMPVYISGADVTCWNDVETILAYTGAVKLMLARPLLANPELLLVREYDNDDDDDAANAAAPDPAPGAADAATRKTASSTKVDGRAVHLAAHYLQMAEQHPPPTIEYIRLHLKWFLRASLQPPPDGPIDYHNIRYKLWNFLQRPYLTSLEQYRAVTVLMCHSLHIAVPPSLLLSVSTTNPVPSSSTKLILPTPQAPPLPTFKSIRHMNDNDSEKNKRKRVEPAVTAGMC
jgi:tRNA-dihydrouridine synthase